MENKLHTTRNTSQEHIYPDPQCWHSLNEKEKLLSSKIHLHIAEIKSHEDITEVFFQKSVTHHFQIQYVLNTELSNQLIT